MSTDPEYAQAEEFDADDFEPRPIRLPSRKRVLIVIALLLGVTALIVVPPLISMNRYRKQIASSVSLSLGRPVRIDSVALNLLPMPGFTLTTFVVGEDPAFGAEPVIRADTVRLTLRVSSLFRRHVEFSRISLTDPSINLVHLPDGRWNLETILLQAARMPAAPTGQTAHADVPRFPYIEATGARVNLKKGLDKLPISLTDAKVSLWLDEPEQWRLRLEAKPTRTDAAPMETGTLRLEGTFGRASTLENVPVNVSGEWSAAPLGAVSWIALGRDAGLRGEMRLAASFQGKAGGGALTTALQLSRFRRADFVPDHPLEVEVKCTAQALALFHQLQNVACQGPAGITAEAQVQDVFHPAQAIGILRLKDVQAATLLDALHVASPSLSPDVRVDGLITGDLSSDGTGQFTVADGTLRLGAEPPLVHDDLSVAISSSTATLQPVPIDLGGAQPAVLSLTAMRSGYSATLTGNVKKANVLALGAAIPFFAKGLAEELPEGELPTAIAATTTGDWTTRESWKPVETAAPVRRRIGNVRKR